MANPPIVKVEWQMIGVCDPWPIIMERNATIMAPWAAAPMNRQNTIKHIVETGLDDDLWRMEWGMDTTWVEVCVQIFEPHTIAGFYSVEIERVFQAEGVKLLDGDPRDGEKKP